MRKLTILGIITIVGIGMCGCNISLKKNNSDDTKKNTESAKTSELVLNERQKEILEEAGLSTNPEELTYSQKKSIVAIEEMLTAVEKKYNRSFSYDGYVQKGPLEYEHLIAYPSDGDPQTDSFEVRKLEGENGTEYEDDYMLVAIRDGFSLYLTNITSQIFKTESVKVFVEVTRTTLDEVPSDEKRYNGAVGSRNYIYIDGSSVHQDEFQFYVEELEKAFYQNELYGISQIILLKEDEMEHLNKYNYSNNDISDSYIEWKEISVQRE